MPCTLFLYFLALVTVCQGTPPSVVSATYSAKSITVQGRQFDYMTYELDFDQDVYWVDNWACSCVNDYQTCRGRSSDTVVNETGYEITELPLDKWTQKTDPIAVPSYFKFELKEEDFPLGCPLVKINVQFYYGLSALYVSNEVIPTPAKFQFSKVAWHRDSLWMCSSSQFWKFGTYYLTLAPAFPASERKFRIKWSVTDVPLCPPVVTLPANLPTEQVATNLPVLQNLQAYVDILQAGQLKYYKFYFNERCSNFAVAARQENPSQDGDLDVFLSFNNPNPGVEDHDFVSQGDGPDGTALMNICSPTGVVPWHIYVSVYSYKGVDLYFRVVATTTHYFELRPLVDLPPQQYIYSFTNGVAEIEWSRAKKRSNTTSLSLKCEIAPYAGCLDPIDPWNNCARFNMIPPHQNANPWIVFPTAFLIQDDIDYLNLDLPRASMSANIAKRVNFFQLLSVSNSEEVRVYSEFDPSVQMKFNNHLVNSAGEPLNPVLSFKPKVVPCNYNKLSDVIADARTTIDDLSNTVSIEELKGLQVQLSFLVMEESVLGCTQLLDTFVETTEYEDLYEGQTLCQLSPDNPAYQENACCDYIFGWEACCSPSDFVFPRPLPIEPVGDFQMCTVPNCTANSVGNYISSVEDIYDKELGCSAQWLRSAGKIDELIQFVFDCSTQLFGPAGLDNIACSSDDDCSFGALCDLANGVCLHTTDHVLDCFLSSMDQVVAVALYNEWRISDPVTPERMREEILDRFIQSLCVGPGSLAFRPHYYYKLQVSSCTDPCTETGVEVRCLDTNPETCPVDDYCLPGSSVWCYRDLTFVPITDNRGCVAEFGCNWLDCGSLSQEECRANCLALSLTPEGGICMDCTKDLTCIEVPGLTRAQCEQGLCDINPALDPAACANAGTCSSPCTGCSKAACEATAICDTASLKEYLVSRGITGDAACFGPFYPDHSGVPYCEDGSTGEAPWGCLLATVTRSACTSSIGKWLSYAVTSQAECETYSGCLNAEGFFNDKDQTACECSGETYKPYFTWQKGIFSQGKVKPLVWKTPEWEPVRAVNQTMDYIGFSETVKRATINLLAIEYNKEAQCRVGTFLDVLDTVGCDCNGTRRDCWENPIVEQEVGSVWVCPHVVTNVFNGFFNLTAYGDSFPPEALCVLVAISKSPANLYVSNTGSRLSSQVFADRATNSYTVIYYNRLIIEGQLISNGTTVDWLAKIGRLDNPMTLCIPIEPQIPQSDFFDIYELGIIETLIDGSKRIVRQDDRDRGGVYVVNGSVCGPISKRGAYIAIKVRDAESTYQSLLAQSVVASIIYWILLAVCTYQLVDIALTRVTRWQQKFFFSIIIFVFLLIRAVYFIVYPIGIIEDAPVASYFVFEFPTFLFLVMNSTIIYLWWEITESVSKQKSAEKVNKKLFLIWFLWNDFILICFIAFIIAYYTVDSGPDPLPCELSSFSNAGDQKVQVSTGYVVFVSIICFFLAALLLFFGLRFFRSFLKSGVSVSSKQKNFFILTWVVMSLFALCFVVKSVLLLIANWVSNFTVPVIVFALLEQIPTAALLYAKSQSTQKRSGNTSTKNTTSTKTSKS